MCHGFYSIINYLLDLFFFGVTPIDAFGDGTFHNSFRYHFLLRLTDQAVVPVVKGVLPTDDTHDWELKGVVNDDTINGN